MQLRSSTSVGGTLVSTFQHQHWYNNPSTTSYANSDVNTSTMSTPFNHLAGFCLPTLNIDLTILTIETLQKYSNMEIGHLANSSTQLRYIYHLQTAILVHVKIKHSQWKIQLIYKCNSFINQPTHHMHNNNKIMHIYNSFPNYEKTS